MKKIAFFDIDGTLTSEIDGSIPVSAIEAIRAARANAAEQSHRERERRLAGKARLRDQQYARKGDEERQELAEGDLLAQEEKGEDNREVRRRLVERLPFCDRNVAQRVKVREDADGAEKAPRAQEREGA